MGAAGTAAATGNIIIDVVSDTTWKVSTAEENGWDGSNPSFDDSGWDYATSFGQNGVLPWLTRSDIGDDAEWIWSSGDADGTVYFRKQIAIPGTINSANLAITADNTFELYVNGQLVGSDTSWYSSHTYDIKPYLLEQSDNNVISVKATDKENGEYYKGLLVDITIDDPPVGSADIPEFPTIALPIVAIMGIMFLFGRKKDV